VVSIEDHDGIADRIGDSCPRYWNIPGTFRFLFRVNNFLFSDLRFFFGPMHANLLLWAYIAKGKHKGCYFPGNMTSGKR